MHLNLYLSFNGNCEEAFRFYETCLGGKILVMMPHEGALSNLVLHARMMVGGSLLMGSDAPPERFQSIQGAYVSVTLDSAAEAERVYHTLEEGGDIHMPMQKTFWAERFGMVADRFGTPWMVGCETPAPAPSKAPERELTIVREIDAPRELVFQAWTEAKHLQQWWGPNGFTNPVCEVDLKVGGAWRIVMRSPGGMDCPCKGVYEEIVAPERLVFTNDAYDADGNLLLEGRTTVSLEIVGAKTTKLTLVTKAVGKVAYAAMMLEGMEPGWKQSLDRLTAFTLAM